MPPYPTFAAQLRNDSTSCIGPTSVHVIEKSVIEIFDLGIQFREVNNRLSTCRWAFAHLGIYFYPPRKLNLPITSNCSPSKLICHRKNRHYLL